MTNITERAVELFRAAEPLAQQFVFDDGREKMSQEDKMLLAKLGEALHKELNIPMGNESPLFIDEQTDLIKQMNVQKIRIALLGALQKSTH